MRVHIAFVLTYTLLSVLLEGECSLSQIDASHKDCVDNSLSRLEERKNCLNHVKSKEIKHDPDLYGLSEERMLYQEDSPFKNRIEKVWSKKKNGDENEIEMKDFAALSTSESFSEETTPLPEVEVVEEPDKAKKLVSSIDENAIHMKDFVASNSKSVSQETSSLARVTKASATVEVRDRRPDTSKSQQLEEKLSSSIEKEDSPALKQPQAVDDAISKKWHTLDASYENYFKEVLGKRFLQNTKNKRKKHQVSTVFQMSEINSGGGEVVEESLEKETSPPPIHEENVISKSSPPALVEDEVFQDCSELPLSSSYVNSTFENQLEEPDMTESTMASKVDSEAKTEYYSMSQENEDEEEVENDTEKLKKDDTDLAVSKKSFEKYENDERAMKGSTEKLKDSAVKVEESIHKTKSRKKRSPRVVKLEVPEHLASDPDRILNAADLERGYISRHFGFYNPEPQNRQTITNFINHISRESKGYEIRTARISKRLFKALTEIQKKSFCEEHVTGNIILRSKNLIYDENADVKSIVTVRKTVVYRWELPSENITAVQCPIKATKPNENTPSAVYIIPVVYDDEYKSPYTFIFTDCTPDDNCNLDKEQPNNAVRLFALSRIDVDYVVEKIKSRLEDTRARVKNFEDKSESMTVIKKSIFDPEERTKASKESSEKPITVKHLIEKYLEDPANEKLQKQLRHVLSWADFWAVQRKASTALKRQYSKKKKEPWLVKIVKHFMNRGKDNSKADFYVDTSTTRKGHFLKAVV